MSYAQRLRALMTLSIVKLRVERIGYLVPAASFDGTVQSVYARACNVQQQGSLYTLLACGAADGPTSFVLDGNRAIDLRACFRRGDAVSRRGARLTSRGAEADLAHATIWRPNERPVVADPFRIAANLRDARARLTARPDRAASVVHRDGRAVCAALEQACRACDCDAALSLTARLIGWGEGLTPAGDDFLVGLLAGLDGAAQSPDRVAFVGVLSAAIVARTHLTTPIAAHCLRLAAGAHFTADLHRLRDALMSSGEVAPLRQLVDDALAVGATSGADRVAGLLAGISAWLPFDCVRSAGHDD